MGDTMVSPKGLRRKWGFARKGLGDHRVSGKVVLRVGVSAKDWEGYIRHKKMGGRARRATTQEGAY